MDVSGDYDTHTSCPDGSCQNQHNVGSCNCDDNDEENSWRFCANLVQVRRTRHHSTLRPGRTGGHALTIREDTIPISQQVVHNVGRSVQVRYAVVIRNEVSVTPQLKGGGGLSLRGVKSHVSRGRFPIVPAGTPALPTTIASLRSQ